MTYPPTRPGRALVLGCTGFLGGRTVEALLAAGTPVTCLVRTKRPDCDFVQRKLFDRVTITRGDLSNGDLLGWLLAAHEVTAVYQCAAAPGPIAATHILTHRVLTAVAAAAPTAAVVVPVPDDLAVGAVKFRTAADGGLRVAFVRLPHLSSENIDPAAVALLAAADAVTAAAPVPTAGLWTTPTIPTTVERPVPLPRAA